ncbi:MAG: hypothetical protein AAF267_01350 [Deinococcota bacterium]
MARTRRPSGLGPMQRRFDAREAPDGSEYLVPLTQDAATYIFLANPDGSWPRKHAAKMLYDVQWLVEGVRVEIGNIGQGAMGEMGVYQVVEDRITVSVDQPRGGTSKRRTEGFGQVKRMVLLELVQDDYDMDELPKWAKK